MSCRINFIPTKVPDITCHRNFNTSNTSGATLLSRNYSPFRSTCILPWFFNWLLITQSEVLCVLLCGPLFVFIFDHCNISKALTIFFLIKFSVETTPPSNAFMNMRDSLCFKSKCQPSRVNII